MGIIISGGVFAFPFLSACLAAWLVSRAGATASVFRRIGGLLVFLAAIYYGGLTYLAYLNTLDSIEMSLMLSVLLVSFTVLPTLATYGVFALTAKLFSKEGTS